MLVDACGALQGLTETTPALVQQVLEHGLVSQLTLLSAQPPASSIPLQRVAAIETDNSVPLRQASLRALAQMISVSEGIHRSALLAPRHSIVPELVTELIDEKTSTELAYRGEIFHCLSKLTLQVMDSLSLSLSFSLFLSLSLSLSLFLSFFLSFFPPSLPRSLLPAIFYFFLALFVIGDLSLSFFLDLFSLFMTLF